MKKTLLIMLFVGALLLMVNVAQAQTQVDLGFSMSGVKGTSSADAGSSYFPQDVGGGAFPGFNGDILFHKYFGIGGEVAWRATQNLSQGLAPFRPIFYDFGAVWAPPLGKHSAAELTTGIGGESVRFYTGTINCSFVSCTDYVSTNHFLWDVGGGIKLYAWHNLFIRPEVRFYLIHNNFEFSSNHATRLGATLGYSFGR